MLKDVYGVIGDISLEGDGIPLIAPRHSVRLNSLTWYPCIKFKMKMTYKIYLIINIEIL